MREHKLPLAVKRALLLGASLMGLIWILLVNQASPPTPVLRDETENLFALYIPAHAFWSMRVACNQADFSSYAADVKSLSDVMGVKSTVSLEKNFVHMSISRTVRGPLTNMVGQATLTPPPFSAEPMGSKDACQEANFVNR